MLTAKTQDPLAALLDAHVDAHHAGVCDSEVEALQQVGERISVLASELADVVNGLTDGRMATVWVGRGERRAKVTFEAAELAEAMIEAGFGNLDAVPVIKTAAALMFAKTGMAPLRAHYATQVEAA